MKGLTLAPLALAVLLLTGCPPPARYSIEKPGLACDRATRVAYRTLVSLGYAPKDVIPPAVGRPGRITAERPGAEGRPVVVGVDIRCDASGVVLQPIEPDLVPNWEFSRAFGYSFKTLEQIPETDVEVPRAKSGLEVQVHVVTPQEAILDLGAAATIPPAVLVRFTVRNNTSRAVRVDPETVSLVAADGTTALPLAGAAAAAALAPGAGGDRVRAQLLGGGAVGAGTTVAGYLLYPGGSYREARVSVEDVETGETDGFVAPVQ
ncbi:MAG TPA: hypothetical protein VFD84_08300 [Candidatus Binatia bacterium]|jgi:hypothetical protein|nr:hypothetical protein [Candidatus Binatia bacterium]